jgi:hypothetical protein
MAQYEVHRTPPPEMPSIQSLYRPKYAHEKSKQTPQKRKRIIRQRRRPKISLILLRRSKRFNDHIQRVHKGSILTAWVPFAECALAAVADAAHCHKTLRDKGSVLEGGGEDTVLMREHYRRGEIGRLLCRLLADNARLGLASVG